MAARSAIKRIRHGTARRRWQLAGGTLLAAALTGIAASPAQSASVSRASGAGLGPDQVTQSFGRRGRLPPAASTW